MPRKEGSRNKTSLFLEGSPEGQKLYQEWLKSQGMKATPPKVEGDLPPTGGETEAQRKAAEDKKKEDEKKKQEEQKRKPPEDFNASRTALAVSAGFHFGLLNPLLIKAGKETFNEQEALTYATQITPFVQKYWYLFGPEAIAVVATLGVVGAAFMKPKVKPMKDANPKQEGKDGETVQGQSEGPLPLHP